MQTQNNQITCLHNITKVGVNLIKPYDCWTFIVLFVSFWRKNQDFVLLWGLSVRSIIYVYTAFLIYWCHIYIHVYWYLVPRHLMLPVLCCDIIRRSVDWEKNGVRLTGWFFASLWMAESWMPPPFFFGGGGGDGEGVTIWNFAVNIFLKHLLKMPVTDKIMMEGE